MNFNPQKFSRQIILPEFGLAAQQKLADAKVLIVGAGGLGCPVIQYLSAVGIGTIGIAENDLVNVSNLPRQILYDESQVGIAKAEAIKNRFSIRYSQFTFHNALSKENILEIVKNYEVIVDTTDNFSTRYLVNDACVLLDKILVSASIHQFNGQLSVFNFPLQNGECSATYRCLFPEAPIESSNCAEAGVLSTVAGVMGTLQAHEVVKVITGIGEILYNKLLLWNGKTMQQSILNFEKNKAEVELIKANGLANDYSISSFCSDEILIDIDVQQLKEKIKQQEKFQLIDVREEFEHNEFNIGGDWIQMKDLLKKPEKISTTLPVILYCKKGERSKIAQQRLIYKFGFNNIFNLKGGTDAWRNFNKK